MRWDALFADLAAQLDEAEHAELAAEVTDRVRREAALLHLLDRIRPLLGAQVRLGVRGCGAVGGLLLDVGPDWLLIEEATGRSTLVPLAGVLTVGGALRYSAGQGSEGVVEGRLRLGYALRALARERVALTVVLTDGSALHGTLDRIGADFAEVAVHPLGEPRRTRTVAEVLVVPFAALALLRAS